MFVRPTNLGTSDAMVYQILLKQAETVNAQNQVITGKKLTKPSQNPVDTSQVLNLKKEQNKVNMYIDNIKSAREQLNMVDKTLEHSEEYAQRIYDLTLQASNGTNALPQLQAIKSEIDQLKESIIDIANSQYNNQYLYSGANTAYKAFTLESDGSITYNGSKDSNSMSRCLEVMDEVFIPLSINGEEIFGSYDATTTPPTAKGILGALSELSKTLDLNPPDHTQISSYLGPLKKELETIVAKRSEMAGYGGMKLDMTEAYLNDFSITLEGRRSDREDIDLIDAVTNLNQKSYAYQASLACFSNNMSLSLLNYL